MSSSRLPLHRLADAGLIRQSSILRLGLASAWRSGLGKAWLAVGIGVLTYVVSKRKADEVPTDVRESIALGVKAAETGAPLSAVEHFDRAVNALMRNNSAPVLCLDLLLRLADAAEAGKQYQRARDALRLAESLALTLEERRLIEKDDSSAKSIIPDALSKKGSGLATSSKESIAHKHLVALTRRADLEETLGAHGTALSLLRSAQAASLEHFRQSIMQRAFSSVVLPVIIESRLGLGAGPSSPPTSVSTSISIARNKREVLTSISGTFFNLSHLLAEKSEKDEEAGIEPGSSQFEEAALHECLASAFIAVVLVTAAAKACHKELRSMVVAPAGAANESGSGASVGPESSSQHLLALPDDSPLITGSFSRSNKGSGRTGGFIPLSTLPLGLPDSLEHAHHLRAATAASNGGSSSISIGSGNGSNDGSTSSGNGPKQAPRPLLGHATAATANISSRGGAGVKQRSGAGLSATSASDLGPTTLSCSLSYQEQLAVCERCYTTELSSFALSGKLASGISKSDFEATKEELEMLCSLVQASSKLWEASVWRLHAYHTANATTARSPSSSSRSSASTTAAPPLR
jgi:hypothetical protein